MTRFLVCLTALLSLTIAVVGDTTTIDAKSFLAHVRFLASDELNGRGNGTPGLEKAAEYIASRFREAGLQPGGDRETFFQPLEVVTGIQVSSGQQLELRVQGRRLSYRLGEDYYPLSLGAGSGTAAADTLPVVFAGYGISADTLGYDDYEGVDVAGKAVLVFRHEPQEQNPDSPFDGQELTRHATFLQKAGVARARGARLVIVVDDPTHPPDRAGLRRWARDPQAEDFGVGVLHVDRNRVSELIGAEVDLDALAEAIDGDLKPRSRVIPGASVRYTERLRKVRRTVRNVIGVLPGHDEARRAEAVVVGAHYDHLGLGGRFSLQQDGTGEIHNGADDNASGTAAMIEVARAAAADRAAFPRTLVFAAFAAEEIGLLGSAYYVNHPTVPLDRTVAMINLDMVGRPQGRVLVSGLDTAPDLEPDLRAALEGIPLDMKTFREGADVGSSDDTSFVLRQIPSIGFFSGFHSDYHRPSDDWEKIDAAGGAAVARLALALARRVAAREDRVAFKPAAGGDHAAGSAGGGGGSSGYGPYFGSVPDFADDGNGVRFAEVRAGSPAAQAGLESGDVLVEFDGREMKTLYDFTFALREKRPGDRVDVVVLRNGAKITATVELGNRP